MIAADAASEIIGVRPCDTESIIASEFGVTVEPSLQIDTAFIAAIGGKSRPLLSSARAGPLRGNEQ
jgi:hypothetical protein